MSVTHPTPKPHLQAIAPYKAGKTSYAAGVVPIKLSSNENPYGASPKAIEAYQKAASTLHRYPDGSCHDVRHALAARHAIPAKQIVCGAGSDELISLLIHAYAGVGDEVLFTEHAFLMYKLYTLAAGATPVEAPEHELRTDVDALIRAVTERTKLVFVANPNNPTGSYIPASDMQRLRDGLPSHILLVIDGAYAECVQADDYDDGAQLAVSTHNTVMLRTFSKIYGLPALRLGWMLAPPAIVGAVLRIKSPFNVTSAAQAAGVAAIEDTAFMAEQHAMNIAQRDVLGEALTAMGYGIHPTQANFVLLDMGSREQAQYMIHALEEKHIYVRDVSSYKLKQHIRISVGTVQENQTLLDAMAQIQRRQSS